MRKLIDFEGTDARMWTISATEWITTKGGTQGNRNIQIVVVATTIQEAIDLHMQRYPNSKIFQVVAGTMATNFIVAEPIPKGSNIAYEIGGANEGYK